ncbi:MAG: peptide chain release factor family protein [Phycisphaerae bacterium]
MVELPDPTPSHEQFLRLPDDALLRQCQVDTYRASGPGGQHRNKVSSAVRLRHEPSGVSAHGDDSRSQHENKRIALKRLRMQIATHLRAPADWQEEQPPEVLRDCIHPAKGGAKAGQARLQIGRKDQRFWQVAAYLLDLLEVRQGRLSEAAAVLGITTSNYIRVLKSHPQLLAATQDIRRRFDHKPIQ